MPEQMENKNRRLLIIGASVLQLPAIKKAREMGFYIGVVDYDPNAVGITFADEYFNVSTIDIDGVTKVAKEFGPDGIVTLATDMPVRSIAAACRECGLPAISFETAVNATDKAGMIRAFEEFGVEHPWYFIAENKMAFDNILSDVSYPCIMKPTDNSGSRGVVLVHSRDELEREYHYSQSESRGGAVIIEEYMQGPEFSVEVMVVDAEPHVLQITDKLTTGAPHFVEMGHSQPTRQNEENRKKIIDLAERACKALGINCGPAHVEIILTDAGPKMVELGARMGGDCITTHLVPLSTGIDMIRATIETACGERPDIEEKFKKGSAIRYFSTPAGVLKEIAGIEEAERIPGVQEITIVKKIGEEISEIGSSVDRIGFVIAQADTADEAVKICEQAIKTITIEIEPITRRQD